jgi:lipopolysaccharide/colanic/teichoic acid biosynthesis glycosyltransferase
LLDIGLSGVGLVLSSPVWAALSAMVKLEDGGPIFYGQERVGEGGRIFHAYKFRSMIPDAEAKVGALQASEHDPRVTRIGRLMRSTAMDELPQLWSIFVGDMSFVGPRALRPGEIEAAWRRDARKARGRARIRRAPQHPPWSDGIAQIYAPRDISRRNKFRYDRLYIKRRGFGLDVTLILLSFWITFRGRWEHRGDKF